MPDDGSGVFSRTNGTATGSTVWAQDLAAARKITAALHDAHDEDIADALNNRLCKDGQNSMTGDLDMGGNDIVNIGSGGLSLPVVSSGTYTPTIIGSGTAGTYNYTQQVGTYTRINDDVWFTILIRGTWSSDPAGDLRISLPFVVQGSREAVFKNIRHINLDADSDLMGIADGLTQYLTLESYDTNGTHSTVTFADQVSNIHELVVQGKFIAAP